MHVWPTVGKYMAYFDNGASYYTNKEDLLDAVKRAFEGVKPKEATPEEMQSIEERKKLQNSFNDI